MSEHASQGMACPICHIPLVMSERQGVEVDYCPQCRGVWLDRGELDKIIARAAVESPAQEQRASPFVAPEQYTQQQGYYQQHGQPPRQRSWWQQIFND